MTQFSRGGDVGSAGCSPGKPTPKRNPAACVTVMRICACVVAHCLDPSTCSKHVRRPAPWNLRHTEEPRFYNRDGRSRGNAGRSRGHAPSSSPRASSRTSRRPARSSIHLADRRCREMFCVDVPSSAAIRAWFSPLVRSSATARAFGVRARRSKSVFISNSAASRLLGSRFIASTRTPPTRPRFASTSASRASKNAGPRLARTLDGSGLSTSPIPIPTHHSETSSA